MHHYEVNNYSVLCTYVVFQTGRVRVEEIPNESNVIDADHTYSSMKVPAYVRVLDSASQTDNPNESSEEYGSEFKQLKLKDINSESYVHTDRTQEKK